jgi:hypothetical protein
LQDVFVYESEFEDTDDAGAEEDAQDKSQAARQARAARDQWKLEGIAVCLSCVVHNSRDLCVHFSLFADGTSAISHCGQCGGDMGALLKALGACDYGL